MNTKDLTIKQLANRLDVLENDDNNNLLAKIPFDNYVDFYCNILSMIRVCNGVTLGIYENSINEADLVDVSNVLSVTTKLLNLLYNDIDIFDILNDIKQKS